MFRFISHRFESLYDRLNSATRREQLEQLVVYLSAWGFLLHLLLIFLARTVPALGTGLLSGLDRNYLHAVYTPFSFILFYEVLLLVLAIPQSHTSSIGKQYEIISLIVVRRVFKDIGEFRSMEGWLTQVETARVVLLDMLGAVAMFLLVTVFYHVRNKVVRSPANQDLAGFIALKKIVAVLLSALLVLLAAYNFFTWLVEVLHLVPATSLPAKDLDVFFFPAFFEVMIFTDVLLLIVSISYYERYQYVFRNAGFVISTVLLRFSLSTEKPYDITLAIVAMGYGLSVLAVFAYFTRVASSRRRMNAETSESQPANG